MGVGQTARPRTQRPSGAPSMDGILGQGVEAIAGVAGRYDRYVDALNRLPRPALMVLTVGLFAYAVLDPSGFAARMAALSQVPEPLWWMQGAVVTFYFGAREAHYHRQGQSAKAEGRRGPGKVENP